MTTKLMNTFKNLCKLGVAGGVIFGVGFLMVTQDPESTEVGPAPAKADISDFMGAPASKSAQFTEAMVAMGLKPRVYDYNGNVMYFAVGDSEQRPRELMHTIQDHLVNYGVNEKNHSDMMPLRDAGRATNWQPESETEQSMLQKLKPLADKGAIMIKDGEVVPTNVTDARIEMIGYDKNKAPADLEKMFEGDESNRPVANLMGGYKYIDAFWDESKQRSEVSAVWSGDDFLASRMEGEGPNQSPPDPDVPSCMGCNRDFRMQTIDNQDSFSANMYATNLGVDQTYSYYRNAMERRGWKEGRAQNFLNNLAEFMPELRAIQDNGRILNLERDNGETMQIAIMPDTKQGTRIISTQEANGAQMMATSNKK